ncbi:MAG: hypothetical protein JSS74_03795 [Actinobacteria bacterium]|nr:hypothetical protein [Actinomycetota bacterium]
MSENRNSELSDDTLTLVLIGAFSLMLFGPTLAARLIPQAASFLVDVHVLTTENVILPLSDAAGLDLGRMVIAAGGVLLLLALVVFAVRRAAARSARSTATR